MVGLLWSPALVSSQDQLKALLENSRPMNPAAAEAEIKTFRSNRGNTSKQPDKCGRTSSFQKAPSFVFQLFALPAHAQEVVEVREQKVKITSVKGDVRLQPAGQPEREATAGDVLCEGDELFAGFDSRAVVKSDNNTTITVQANTQIRIATLAERRFDIRLERGEVHTVVKTTGPTRPDVRIITPTATASVRGTEFDVRYDETTKETNVRVLEGRVEVVPENKDLVSVTLLALQETRVSEIRIEPVQTSAETTRATQGKSSGTTDGLGAIKIFALAVLVFFVLLAIFFIMKKRGAARR